MRIFILCRSSVFKYCHPVVYRTVNGVAKVLSYLSVHGAVVSPLEMKIQHDPAGTRDTQPHSCSCKCYSLSKCEILTVLSSGCSNRSSASKVHFTSC